MKFFSDRASISKRLKTPEGFVVIKDVKIARTGIQVYAAGELADVPGMPEKFKNSPMAPVRVARLADEVFAPEAMASFQNSPMTNNHPGVSVDASNVKDLQVGFSFGDVRRVGEFMEVDLKVQDAAAIKDIDSGKEEISNGYDADIRFEDGMLNGEPFDAVMFNIRGNHIALVDKGRAGSNVRLSDNHKPKGKKTMPKIVLVDGLPYEFEDQGALVVEKLVGQVATLGQQIEDAAATHASVLKAEEAAHTKTKGELTGEKAKHLTDAQIDERVAKRAALLTDAKTVLGDEDLTGVSELDVKKKVIAKINDGIDLTDKDEAFVEGVYSTLVATAKSGSAASLADELNKGLGKKPASNESEVEKAQKRLREDTAKAWQPGATA